MALQAELTTLEDYMSELLPTSPLQPKLQQMLEKWQALSVDARPADPHPVKRPPTPPKGRRAEAVHYPLSTASSSPVRHTGGATIGANPEG